MQAVQRFIGILHQNGLRHFQFQQMRRQCGTAQRTCNTFHKIGLLELHGRYVDGHGDRVTRALPVRRLTHCFVQHPVADLDNQPGFFCQRNEYTRRHLAQFVIGPADQGLCAAQFTRRQTDLRLVMQPEPTQLQRLTQRMFHLHPGQDVGIHLGLIKAEAAPSLLLDLVHRSVGALDQRIQRTPILREQRYADAGPDREAHFIHLERQRQRIQNATGGNLGTPFVHAVQKQGKFIPTESAKRVHITQALLDALGHFNQHAVAKSMPHGVIDVLEPVQIQKEDTELPVVTLGDVQRKVHPLGQQQPVGQTRQHIAVGQLFNPLLRRQLLGQVLEIDDGLQTHTLFIAQRHPRHFHRAAGLPRAAQPKTPMP